MSAAVAAGLLILVRRIICCFSWKLKSTSKSRVKDTLSKITKKINVFWLAFSLNAYSLPDKSRTCVHLWM